MPDENSFTLRQIDQARADLYAINDELEFIKFQISRLPTRRNLLDIAALIVLSTTGLMSFVMWMLLR